MEQLLPQLFNGLILGAFYAVVALGLSLIMNLTGTINMAHGSFLTLAGYLGFALVTRGTSFWFALIVAPLMTVVVGILVERLLIRPLYGREPFYSLLLTFGLSLVAEEVYRLIWGANGVPFSPPFALAGTVPLGFMSFPAYRLFIALMLIVAIVALALFLTRTRFGLRLRAAVLDSEMIAALGTNTQLLYMVNFGVGILLAGIAGVLAAGLLGLSPTSGNALLMPAFVCVIIGGMGSLFGSIAGGVLIGIAISLTTLYIPAASEVAMYILMAVVLLVRPRGLFGEEGLFG
ncbi:MAG: branched-chain amino acid ABC transporter permease [Candidatus Eremiobacteraeota bacterium]|nr:branched-chain amino acid ABC transporter permease [Candidatus Eremiobacteraeota bacterium]MBV8355764.1 branched-chain amino acid ABC transporter permease [Candidatus Eremiobacteraeota bacterium]